MEIDIGKINLSVIIPVYNRERLIHHCLDSIYKTSYPNFEVIVVDDASTDNSIKIAKKFPCKIIKLRENGGVAIARNAGAKFARGNILYFVDSDVMQTGDNITKIINEFEKGQVEVLAASLSKDSFNQGFGPSFIALKNFYLTTHVMDKNAIKRQRVTFLSTCSVAIKKELFDKASGFDTSFKLGGEEHELGHRISKEHKIYIYRDILVTANMPTILERAIILLKRSIRQISIFSKWRKFEPIGSLTLREALITLLVLSTMFSFLFTLVYPKIIFILLLLLGLFLVLNLRFYYFTFKQKNFLFMIKSIFAGYILYIFKGLGTSIGLLKLPVSWFK